MFTSCECVDNLKGVVYNNVVNVSLDGKKVCFFGHRKLFNSNSIRERLKNTIIEVIKYDCKDFSMGNHGDFDRLALSVCRELRNTYKQMQIIKNKPTACFSELQSKIL